MASNDPKAGRALEVTPDHGSFEAEEDPLVELARIVSEDGGFAAPKTEKPKMNRNEPSEPSATSDGLEAELLQELESSLGARETRLSPAPPIAPAQRASSLREVPIAPRPTRAFTPPPPRPIEEERDPEDLLRSIEEQLGQFERRQAERLAATTASFAPVAREPEAIEEPDWDSPAKPDEPAASKFDAPAEEAPREDWQGRRAARIRPLDDEDDAPAPLSDWEEPAAEPAPPPRAEYRFRGPASSDRALKAGAPEATSARSDFRRTEEPTPNRADGLAGFSGKEASDADLFAPAGKHRRDPFTEAEPIRDVGDEPKYSTEAFRRRRQATKFPEFDDIPPPPRDSAADRAEMETRLSEALEPRDPAEPPYSETGADEPRVAAAIAPGASRRAAAARAQAAQRGRARGAVLMIAGVIVVVALGGAAALYLRSNEGPGEAPLVISADQGPVKVEAAPDKTQTDSDATGNAVYDRVAGNAPEANAPATNEQVVDNAEEPREVARIVLPPPQQPDTSASDSTETTTASPTGEAAAVTNEADEGPAASADEIGPRKVPTYAVRPDGTIVASNDDAATSTTAAAAQKPASSGSQTAAAETAKPAVQAMADSAPAKTAAANTPAANDALPPDATESMTPRPAIDEPAEVAVATPPKPAAASTSAKPKPPVDLLNTASASATAAVPTPAASGSGYLVQVSSQRSKEQAQSAFADMQKRYPSVLGPLSPNVQEADLGAKGIYFRVRVGPWTSRDEAAQVCDALKAAGGSCFVTQ